MATTETYVPRLKQRYNEELRHLLQEELELDSIMQVPRITKLTLNMGVGEAKTDGKVLDAAVVSVDPAVAVVSVVVAVLLS